MSPTRIPHPARYQHQWTLQESVSLSGKGLHSGKDATITFHPAAEDSGIVFLGHDGAEAVRIPALAGYVTETTLSTTLSHKNVTLRTVEHALAAVYGLGISNVLIEVQGGELPAADGCAAEYCRRLLAAGIQVQGAPRQVLRIDRPCWVAEDDKFIVALPDDRLQLTYITDYNHALAGPMLHQVQLNPDNFFQEIADARTFCFRHEVEELFRRGLGLGGTLDNALVIGDDGYSSPMRYPNEPVRHKVLDLIGDLALVGVNLQAHVLAVKAGHALHTKLARQLLKRGRTLAAAPHPAREVSRG